MKIIVAASILACATPALAQPAAPIVADVVDPARVTSAASVIDQLWPVGTYRRMIEGPMSKAIYAMMMMDTRVADVAGAAGASGNLKKSAGSQTLAQRVEANDPAFRERMRVIMDVMQRELTPLIERIEPGLRIALTQSYARNFTLAQLGDLHSFLSTASGQVYAQKAMMLSVDPEIARSNENFVPKIIGAMPDIVKKVEAATARLPKSRAPKE